MREDLIRMGGRLSVYNTRTGKLIYRPEHNTITYTGLDWILNQALNFYGTSRPIMGMRIGNGGASSGLPLTNDPSLTDVRDPIYNATNEYMEIVGTSFTHSSPYTVEVSADFSTSDYSTDDFRGNMVINEAGLWVPGVGGATSGTNGPVLVSYSVTKNDSGALAEIPVVSGLDLRFVWELGVN